MPSFLLEFFSEEIPARMQKRAEEDLARMASAAFEAAGLGKIALRTLSGPRRIAVMADDLPARAADVNEERKGPRVGAPEKALEGFLKAAGLSKIEDAEIQKDPKGDFYVARIARKGRSTPEIVADAAPKIAKDFPWPKSMRSGSSDFIWVRPLHGVLCLFDGEPVRFQIGNVTSGDYTWGHRFHSKGAITIANAAEYEAKLRAAHVIVDREVRKATILEDARWVCSQKKLELVEDAGLLEEVAGLAEWPVVVIGDMDPAFLDLPAEVIRLTMRTHQRYFAVRDGKTGKLAPHFVTVANVEPIDGGNAIAAGNARVLSARLNDARFFWDGDRKTKLEDRVAKLDQIVFHQKLGSVGDKVKRVRALARELAPLVGADPELADRAALLAKADLVTEVVGEFPELQGQIGRQLYLIENELDPNLPLNGGGGRAAAGGGGASHSSKSSAGGAPPQSALRADSSPIEGELGVVAVATAIEDHYRPAGPNDRVPTDTVAIAVAISDKLDTLVGFWAIDEKPTGSRDPYALRRSALGVVRTLIESKSRLHLRSWLEKAWFALVFRGAPSVWPYQVAKELRLSYAEGLTEFAPVAPPSDLINARSQQILTRAEYMGNLETLNPGAQIYCYPPTENGVFSNLHVLSLGAHLEAEYFAICQYQVVTELLVFLADRLKVQLRDQGKRHDLVDAVFALGDDDLVRIVARVEALDAFLKTEDGANILAGYRRAANILAAEEKKGQGLADADVNVGYQKSVLAENPQPAEQALLDAVNRIGPDAKKLVKEEQFGAAMTALAGLRAPLDLFFEQVLVNDPKPDVRRNRLLLLTQIRDALSAVADFSKIEG